MSEPQKKSRINIPRDLSEEERNLLADKVVNLIKERTDKNKDINGSKFAPYSKSYVESKDFKNAGKSKSDVNLRLSNEMMDSIQLIDQGPGYITVGFESGTDANDKAVWQERSDNGVSRKFVGINDKDLARLLAEVKVESPTKTTKVDTLAKSILKFWGL